MRELAPVLYSYSKIVLRRYPWLGQDTFRDYVHDAVRDASASLAGTAVTRVWNTLAIDLKTYCMGHVRSRIWKDANLHSATKSRPLDEIEFFQGRPIDELIALTGIKIDLLKVFKNRPEIVSVLLVIFRDFHYSKTAIAQELAISVDKVERAWLQITAVARALGDGAA